MPPAQFIVLDVIGVGFSRSQGGRAIECFPIVAAGLTSRAWAEIDDGRVGMWRLISYAVGAAAAAGAEYLYVASSGPLEGGHPSGWVILFLFYLGGGSGVAGGLISLVVVTRLEPRYSRVLSLAQGIIAMLAPLAVMAPADDFLAADNWFAAIVAWALSGAVGALLLFGLYAAGRMIVRWSSRIRQR